jgi:4-hydroxy-3-polyprenylbenzoate decarboxylase
MIFGDLRGWIEALRQAGELQEIDAEVDWDVELGTITRRAMASGQGPALLFKRIKDYRNGRCTRIFTASMSSYRRIAMMYGLPADASITNLVKHSRELFKKRMPPVEVASGPVKQHVLKGEAIDLFEFPAPRWNRRDGGRYLLTMQGNVTKDPETGRLNVGIYRGMIGKENTIPSLLSRAQNWGQDFLKYAARGEEMPVACVIGGEPAFAYMACTPLPPQVSEYDVMGAMLGKPVELVRCETVPLLVPANAEIVIEGWISPDPKTFEMEGPYGEYTGYYAGDQGPKHTIRVTCITHRDDPILQGSVEGTLPGMMTENSMMSSIQRAAIAWNVLDNAGVPGITDVHCPAANNGTTIILQMRPTYRGQAKQAAMALWGASSAHVRYKHVWAVNDDIDIHDYNALDWAFAWRVNAAEDDVLIVPGTFGAILDPSTRLKYRDPIKYGTGKWARMLIDATVNLDFEPEEQYGGERYPPSVRPSKEDWDYVDKRWKDYGFKE